MQARISQLDLLRGIAILGIPFMNMVGFSMPMAAYLNPKAYLAEGPLNDYMFIFLHLFADQKFMGLFALLFGAGIILLAEKRKYLKKSAAKIHYSRNFWLLVVGMLHAIYIWEGDILTVYALIAMVLYVFRRLRGGWLITLGIMVLIGSVLSSNYTGVVLSGLSGEARYIVSEIFSPDAAQIQRDIAAYSGGFWELVNHRLVAGNSDADFAASLMMLLFSLSLILKVSAMMLLGMGLYKTGVLSGEATQETYKRLAVTAIPIGLILTSVGLIGNYSHGWDINYYFLYGDVFNLVGATFTSIGYIGLVCLWYQTDKHQWMKNKIQQVGRMAFTNYLVQSVICVFIFYGFGLGLYGELTRIEVASVCIALVLFQLAYSDLWLKVFSMGPLEWFWRTLTYLRIQPIFKEKLLYSAGTEA
ncbi:DUF418 domain-containing protein [Microbulbifer variabilis]|uniref:DUF418 domain-containing protein n=1 Tax=Microbulbifer variabilis TaxID=266805 RepID=UPI001CFDDB8C|nr:DUF418 domain-containing protein [Microbulbifer variabilis]